MAEKKDEAEKKPGAKEEGEGDTPKAASSRSKLMIILGVAAIFLIAASVGGFFVYKKFFQKDHASATLQDPSHPDPSKKNEVKKGEAEHPKPEGKAESNHESPKKDEKSAKDDKEKTQKKPDNKLGAIYNIPKMELNVGGPDLNRGFLRIAIAIEFLSDKDDALKELEARTPQYKDIIINKVGNTPKNDLLTARGREDLRKSILNAINTVNERPIKSLYFTEFLVE